MDGVESDAAFVIVSASAVAAAEKSGSSPRSVIARRAMVCSCLRFCAEGWLIPGQEYDALPNLPARSGGHGGLDPGLSGGDHVTRPSRIRPIRAGSAATGTTTTSTRS